MRTFCSILALLVGSLPPVGLPNLAASISDQSNSTQPNSAHPVPAQSAPAQSAPAQSVLGRSGLDNAANTPQKSAPAKSCCCCKATQCHCGCETPQSPDENPEAPGKSPARFCGCDDVPLGLPNAQLIPERDLQQRTIPAEDRDFSDQAAITSQDLNLAHGPPPRPNPLTSIVLLI